MEYNIYENVISSEEIKQKKVPFKTILKAIVLDKKNNSFRSFCILALYRLLHRFWQTKHIGFRFALLSIFKGLIYWFMRINAQISYKAEIGSDIRLPHSAEGVVISSKAIIEDHQTIYHQVTIGINENKPLELQRIIVRKNCYLSAGCKIISCEVGEGSKIGPNAVVFKDLPPHSLYVSSNQLVY